MIENIILTTNKEIKYTKEYIYNWYVQCTLFSNVHCTL